MKSFTVMLTILALTLMLGTTSVRASKAMSCYVCEGDEACRDPYGKPEEHLKQDCAYCSKTKIVIGGSQTVTRVCTPTSVIDIASAIPAGCNSEGGSTICFCKEDACNGTPKVTCTSGLLFGFILLIWGL